MTPKNGSAYIFYVSLVSQSNTKTFQSTPTLAAGDFKVSIDGGTLNNLTTLPTNTPASSKMVKISLSAAEMTGDNICIVCSDAAGAEWCDLTINIQTSARQIDDLAYPATSGRSTAIDASGQVTVGAIAANAITAASVATDVSQEIRAEMDSNSTKLASIDAKTTNLPSDPADESLIIAAIAGISAGGATAADVWAYASRTLTQTAAQVTAAVSGSDLAIVIATTFAATLTGLTISALWTKCYFTIKPSSRLAFADSDAQVQILVSNPGAAGDGLLYLGAAAATANQASLVVDDDAGTVAILIKDEATAELAARSYQYDLKVVMADGSSVLLTSADVVVSRTPTASLT